MDSVDVAEKNLKNSAIKEVKGAQGGRDEDKDEEMDTDDESVESWSGEALGLEECLFCSHISKTLEKNVSHMTVAHSFFIPDVEFLVDLEGLITYLGEYKEVSLVYGHMHEFSVSCVIIHWAEKDPNTEVT